MQHWQFLNTYSMGKHLTEQLVAEAAATSHFPVAIVRPSFVVGVAGDPYPGYVGNLAGPGGFGLAYGLGFLQVGRLAAGGWCGGGTAVGGASSDLSLLSMAPAALP